MSDGAVLVGLPGSGKTTVGRILAERLGRPFVDIDAEITSATGREPAEILAEDGEPAFRAVEREAVAAACAMRGAVIATGGGSVLDPLNRWAFADHGTRILLDAPVEILAARLDSDPGARRPLLGPGVADGLARTATERAAFYAAVDARIDADDSVDAVARRAADAVSSADSRRWRPLYDDSYRRHHPIGPELGRFLTGRGLTAVALSAAVSAVAAGTPAIVADAAALAASAELAAALPTERRCDLDAGEQTKTLARLEQLLNWLAANNVERSEPLVAVGGGTLGDVAGLAAALHRRGMPLVNVPTTWLAQADSALGGKVAADLPAAKNGIGAFWPAWLTLVDANLPETLPIERRRDGLTECLKMGLIGDAALWQLVVERGAPALRGEDAAAAYAMTERAARLKLQIVDRDPYESGERRKLNLGHTIGHALEIESGYTLAHGAAVALGLRAVARIAKRRGAQGDLVEGIDSVVASLGFDLTRAFERAAVITAMSSDKKRVGGRQRWILPMAVGEVVEADDVTDAELAAALDAISA